MIYIQAGGTVNPQHIIYELGVIETEMLGFKFLIITSDRYADVMKDPTATLYSTQDPGGGGPEGAGAHQ